MTIITLYQHAGNFECYADTLISIPNTLGIRKYCKVLAVPIRWNNFVQDKVQTGRHSIAMAIAGNLAAATSVFTVASNVLQNLNSFDNSNRPHSEDIADFFLRLANEVYDEVRPLGQSASFGFFLFGFEVDSSKPFAFEISTSTKPVRVGTEDKFAMVKRSIEIRNEGMDFLGSGAVDFQKYLVENNVNQSSMGLAERFFYYVKSGTTPTVGGLPQILFATPEGVKIDPLLIGKDDGSHAEVTHSGMVVDGYNVVGPFNIGREMRGFNMAECKIVQALKDAELSTNKDEHSVGTVNRAVLDFELGIAARSQTALSINGFITVESPKEPKAGTYFGYCCHSCGCKNPIFKAVGDDSYQPFPQQVKVDVTCLNCSEVFRSDAQSFERLVLE